MLFIDPESRTPVFEQIKEQIIFLVQKGVYSENDRLPSIRALAGELSLNVNTVKRAFNELENEGIVYSRQGMGVFIARGAKENEAVKQKALSDLKDALYCAKGKGLTEAEAVEAVKALYENDR